MEILYKRIHGIYKDHEGNPMITVTVMKAIAREYKDTASQMHLFTRS